MRPTRVLQPFYRLRGMLVSNVFVLDGGPGDRFVIDTGHRVERATLLAGLRSLPFVPSELTGVLLTHHHSDHAGNAAFLRERFGLRVYAHASDAAFLEGRARAPRLVSETGNAFARLFAAIENRTGSRVVVDHALEGGDTVGGLEVHHAPGHTDGSVLYRHAATSSLLSGDALLAAVPPLTIEQRMCLPHPDFASSYEGALASLGRFLREGWAFENLLAGHGRPILGGAREQALELVAR